MRCAVVGAGISGLACARALSAAGAAVTVFEREAVAGGRVASCADSSGRYDPGAQYFTVADADFRSEVDRWLSQGVVQRWDGVIGAFEGGALVDRSASAERYVGLPVMQQPAAALAQGLQLRFSTDVSAVHPVPGGWERETRTAAAAGEAPFDVLLLALPSEAAAELLDGLTPLADLARTVTWDPCWAVTMALAHETPAAFGGVFINDDPILGWAALDSSKPGRERVPGIAERWVLHARPQWSRRYAELEPGDATRWLIRSFSARLRCSLVPVTARARLWAHATPVNPLPQRCLWDGDRRVGLAGDWCGGARIESAYLSGLALAEAVLG